MVYKHEKSIDEIWRALKQKIDRSDLDKEITNLKALLAQSTGSPIETLVGPGDLDKLYEMIDKLDKCKADQQQTDESL